MKRQIFRYIIVAGTLFLLLVFTYLLYFRGNTAEENTTKQSVAAKNIKQFESKHGYSFSYPDFIGGGSQIVDEKLKLSGVEESVSFQGVSPNRERFAILVSVEKLSSGSPRDLETLAKTYEDSMGIAGITFVRNLSENKTVNDTAALDRVYVLSYENLARNSVRFWLKNDTFYVFSVLEGVASKSSQNIANGIFNSLQIRN